MKSLATECNLLSYENRFLIDEEEKVNVPTQRNSRTSEMLTMSIRAQAFQFCILVVPVAHVVR